MPTTGPFPAIEPVPVSSRILGIESSCDETAAAVVENGRTILSSVVARKLRRYSIYTETLRGKGVELPWRMEEAVLSLLSADVFDKTPIHRPLLAFKTIYWISTLWNWRESLASWRQRQRAWNTRLDYEWQSGD